MVECRHCRRLFRDDPEHLGARCPSCRLPLYERAESARPPLAPGMAACAVHPSRPSIAACRLCRTPLCQVCRTRWREQAVCPACIEKALGSPETAGDDPRLQRRQAVWSLVLGLAGWGLLLLGSLPLVLMSSAKKELAILSGLVILFSFVPALFALGQGTAGVRSRGDCLRLATTGLALSGSQLGMMIGLLLLKVWTN